MSIAEEVEGVEREARKLRKKILRVVDASDCNLGAVGVVCIILAAECAVEMDMPKDKFIELMLEVYDEAAEREANDHH